MAVRYSEIKIPAESLEIGMDVVRLDKPWEETSFLLQGFVISNAEELDELKAQCEFAFVRVEDESERKALLKRIAPGKMKPAKVAESDKTTSSPARYPVQTQIEKELIEASGSFRKGRDLAKNMLSNIRLGRSLDMTECEQVVDRCVDSIIRNPSALLLLTQIKNRDEYTAEHSMNVCILAATFARHLELSEADIKTVGLCGLLHDVGKNKIDLAILNKAGALTTEEFDEMKKHPTYGKDLLMSVQGSHPITVDVTYSHHEREDGNGYPRGLAAENIPYFAKLVSLADTYDAITSNRCYDKSRTSAEALDIIFNMRGTQFNKELAEAFIECIGEFPPGSLVELTNGEVGIVTKSYKQDRTRPKVLIVRNAEKRPLPQERIVDLRQEKDRPVDNKVGIYSELRNGSFGIDIQVYLDNGLIVGQG